MTSQHFKSEPTVVTTFDENQAKIVGLFNEVRTIYSSNVMDDEAEKRLDQIVHEFSCFNNEKGREGVIYAIKGLAILYHRRGLQADIAKERATQYEKAHDLINDAIAQARKLKKLQPSLLKHQIAIKTDLAEVLHLTGDHYNASLIERSASIASAEIKENFPDYAEGFLAATTASFKKLKWMMGKMLWDLSKTETLLNKPVHTKHKASDDEVQQYLQEIYTMRSTLDTIYQTIKA